MARFTSRQRFQIMALLGAVALVAVALSAEPLARRLARGAALRRGLTLEVGSVWPTLSGVRLVGCHLGPSGVPGVDLGIDELRLGLSLGFRLKSAGLVRPTLSLRGSPERLREDLSAWRASRSPGTAEGGGHPVEVELTDGALLWFDGDDAAPKAELHGISGARTIDGAHIAVPSLHAELGPAALTIAGGAATFDARGTLVTAHATSVGLAWETHRRPPPSTESAAEPPSKVEAGTPLLDLPDLRVAHAIAAQAATRLSGVLGPNATIDVDAASWKLLLRGKTSITVGPGPASIARDDAQLKAAFTAGATDGGPSLAVRAAMPLGGGDSTLDLEGGPVSLAALGFQEGTAGLFDVAHATVSGHAHLALAGDVHDLTFDCAGAARGVSIRDHMLATDDVRGLDVQLRARGVFSMPGDLRFDDLAATLGALHVDASGVLDQRSDHVAATMHVVVPVTPCRTVLESIPTALVPLASDMAFSGTFGAEGRIAFDSRSLDDLALDFHVRDACRATAVPTALARDTLLHPFTHRIYLPDGSTEDELTGPGTDGFTPLDRISPYMEVAVTTTEDGSFRTHHGFSPPAIRGSIIANLKARRFVRGASTISMQLAKNLFLSREKTLSRKLEEVILTDYIEQILTKDEILELYFNVVEFGPAIYGIGAAADYYFGRSPAELDMAEAFFLASILPAPLRLGLAHDGATLSDSRLAALRLLMRAARKRGLITDPELEAGVQEPVEFWHGGQRPTPRPPVPARSRLEPPDAREDTAPEPVESDTPPQ